MARKYSTCARRRKPWWEGNTSITCAQRSVGKTSAIINEAIEAGEWKRRVRFGSSRMVNEVFCSLLLAKRLKQANASSSLHKFLPLMVIAFATFYIRCSVWKRRVPILVIFTVHPSLTYGVHLKLRLKWVALFFRESLEKEREGEGGDMRRDTRINISIWATAHLPLP